MPETAPIYSPEQQARIDAANRKGLAGFRKQFTKKATAEQHLAQLLEKIAAVEAAWVRLPAEIRHGAMPLSCALFDLRQQAIDAHKYTPRFRK